MPRSFRVGKYASHHENTVPLVFELPKKLGEVYFRHGLRRGEHAVEVPPPASRRPVHFAIVKEKCQSFMGKQSGGFGKYNSYLPLPSTTSLRRSVSQCLSRLQMNPRSFAGAPQASLPSRDSTGIQLKFHVSSAFERT